MKFADLLALAPDAPQSIADTDPVLGAALDADFTMFWGGIIADMDRVDAEAQQAAMTERVSGGHTLH
jgi:hypothetical protein